MQVERERLVLEPMVDRPILPEISTAQDSAEAWARPQ